MTQVGYLKTPCGVLKISEADSRIIEIRFTTQEHAALSNRRTQEAGEKISCINGAMVQMREYFNGKRRSFSVNIKMHGTVFQKSVWAELKRVPYGRTITYAELASRVGKPLAVRAVANAVAKNPLAILIPCHRVVRSDGQLGGYAWGIEKKKKLLEYEQLKKQAVKKRS